MQLKELFEKGILTRQEYETKIKQIQNKEKSYLYKIISLVRKIISYPILFLCIISLIFCLFVQSNLFYFESLIIYLTLLLISLILNPNCYNILKNIFNSKNITKSIIPILLIILIITSISISIYFIVNSNNLIEYWGTDYIAEIYQDDYSLEKFLIQINNFAISFILFSTIVIIFNIKNKLILTIFYISILISTVSSNYNLNFAPQENSLDAIGTHDLGKK